ncbi:MAG TPA: cyclic nucleotide-binding domain-containing protein [Gaiellaceae bacterium]|nr:cyclic nucleotide-binding domain-containing protein [Gaiellaceae bacterium]
MQTLDEIVAEAPLFAGLEQHHLETIAACSTTAGFEEGDYVFREGQQADVFYLLRRGTVALETFAPTRGAIRLTTIHEGDVLGWSWLFPPYRWHFDARAIEALRAVAFDGTCLRRKCADDHDLGYELMLRFADVMVSRLQASRLQLLDVYGDGHG